MLPVDAQEPQFRREVDKEISKLITRLDGATFELTTNTNLRITVVGSDGTPRSVDLTLS